MRLHLRLPTALALATLALGAAIRPPSACASILVSTNTDSMGNSTVSDGDGPLQATALFTFGTNTLTIVLTNLQKDYNAAGQAISGLNFTISGTPMGLTFTGGSGVEINFTKHSVVATYNNSNSSAVATSVWGTSGTNSVVALTALTGGQPSQMIIGPPTSETSTTMTYSNWNGAQDQFDPYLKNSATFSFTFTGGVTSATTVSNVSFAFGTSPDYTTKPNEVTTTVVPEPPTFAAAAFAAMASLAYGWRRKRASA